MSLETPALRQVHLKPGELVLTPEPSLVVTVLGSCVAITFFSVWPRYAGICHAMLPRPRRDNTLADPLAGRFKYLSEAIPFMLARFHSKGIATSAIEVKMFGGANVTCKRAMGQDERLIGNVNIETARQMLEAESLLVKATNVGGLIGRKLVFNTETGEVMHKHLPRAPRKVLL